MQRYFITLSFKGTDFHGWQHQENAKTVQHEIEQCLNIILREDIRLTGCGRTDTGVHAVFFVAHFDLRKELVEAELVRLLKKVNMFLPDSIVIHKIFPVIDDLHSRFSAVQRTYKYFIARRKIPFLKEFSYEFTAGLNIRLMMLACNILKQHKDFSSFSKTGGNCKTNICHVYSAEWTEYPDKDLLVFTITADRFLRNMVRAIVGTMLDIGREKISLSDFRRIFELQNRSAAGMSIDAKGLFLWDVEYQNLPLEKPSPVFFT
jgi:tRNA pseudouridine38-40 synthase